MAWSVEGLGQGYSTVTTADKRIYLTGKLDNSGWLFAFDLNGEMAWKVEYGKETDGSGYPGARTTPTVHDGVVYVISGYGIVSAFSASDGTQIWSVPVLEQYKGKSPYFGISESALIDGGNLICTPGGADASIVAPEPQGRLRRLDLQRSFRCGQLLFRENFRQRQTSAAHHLDRQIHGRTRARQRRHPSGRPTTRLNTISTLSHQSTKAI